MVIVGAWSFRQMPVDAYQTYLLPWLSSSHSGPHAAEEVERLTTLQL